MRTGRMAIIALCVVLLSGCDLGIAVSLHPIAAEEQPQFESALLGRWQVENGDDILQFEKSATGEYRMLVFKQSSLEEDPDAAPQERYTVQALRLGRFVFLDLTDPSTSGDLLKIPVHIFLRVELNGDEFELAALDDRWLKSQLEQKRLEIAHQLVDGQVILTAPPAELREFLQRNAWDDAAFPPDTRYRRM